MNPESGPGAAQPGGAEPSAAQAGATQPDAAQPAQPAPPARGLLSSLKDAVRRGLGLGPADVAGARDRVPRGAQVYAAAFGKHPGWADHIDDIGVDTDRLAALKRILYVNGIGGNIDTRAWERLQPAERLPRFHHAFLWRVSAAAGGGPPDDLLAGRFWASRDTKGRHYYPMVVAAHTCKVGRPWLVRHLPAALEQAERRCAATASADEVRATIAATRDALRAAVRAVGHAHSAPSLVAEVPLSPSPPEDALAFLVNRPEMGEGHRGLLAVLYEVEREMAAFRPASAGGTRSVSASADARHLRVPACGLPPFAAMNVWIDVLATQLSRSAPVLAICPLDEPWVDLVVGEPEAPDLYCILASRKKIPFTTDIPYSFDDEFLARAERLIEPHRRDGRPG